MLRQNAFVGINKSHHYPRYILEGDDRVSTPILFHLRPARTPVQPFSRVGMGDELLMKLLFDNVDTQEGTYYIAANDDEMQYLVLPNLPVGARIWFYKHSNVDKFAQEHYDYLEPIKRSKYLLSTLNFKNAGLNLDVIKKAIIRNHTKLDQIADRLNAGPWKVFNLGEFFGDGTDVPTELLVRLAIVGPK